MPKRLQWSEAFEYLAYPQLRVRVRVVRAVGLPVGVRARGGRAEEVQGAQRPPVEDAQVRRPIEHVLEGVRRPVGLPPAAAGAKVVDEVSVLLNYGSTEGSYCAHPRRGAPRRSAKGA